MEHMKNAIISNFPNICLKIKICGTFYRTTVFLRNMSSPNHIEDRNKALKLSKIYNDKNWDKKIMPQKIVNWTNHKDWVIKIRTWEVKGQQYEVYLNGMAILLQIVRNTTSATCQSKPWREWINRSKVFEIEQ